MEHEVWNFDVLKTDFKWDIILFLKISEAQTQKSPRSWAYFSVVLIFLVSTIKLFSDNLNCISSNSICVKFKNNKSWGEHMTPQSAYWISISTNALYWEEGISFQLLSQLHFTIVPWEHQLHNYPLIRIFSLELNIAQTVYPSFII